MSDRKVPWHKKNNSNNGSVGGGGAYKKNQVGPSKSNNNRVGNWNNSSDGGYGNPKNRQYASPNIEPWDTRQRRNNNDHSWIKSNRGMKRSYNLTTHDDTCVQNFEPSGKSSRTSYDQCLEEGEIKLEGEIEEDMNPEQIPVVADRVAEFQNYSDVQELDVTGSHSHRFTQPPGNSLTHTDLSKTRISRNLCSEAIWPAFPAPLEAQELPSVTSNADADQAQIPYDVEHPFPETAIPAFRKGIKPYLRPSSNPQLMEPRSGCNPQLMEPHQIARPENICFSNPALISHPTSNWVKPRLWHTGTRLRYVTPNKSSVNEKPFLSTHRMTARFGQPRSVNEVYARNPLALANCRMPTRFGLPRPMNESAICNPLVLANYRIPARFGHPRFEIPRDQPPFLQSFQSPVDTYHHSSSYGQLREEMSKFDGFNREPVQIIKENWRDGGGLGQRRYQNNEPPVNPYGDGWISGIPGEEHTSSGYNRSPLTYNRGSPKKSALNFENAQVKREVIATKLPSEAVQPRMKRVKDPGWKPAPLKEPLHEWGKGWKPIMTENYQKICAKMEARATLGTRFGKIDNRGKEVPLISQAKVIREFAPKTIDPNEANTEASRSPEVAMGSLYIEVTPNVSDANEAALSENVEKESDESLEENEVESDEGELKSGDSHNEIPELGEIIDDDDDPMHPAIPDPVTLSPSYANNHEPPNAGPSSNRIFFPMHQESRGLRLALSEDWQKHVVPMQTHGIGSTANLASARPILQAKLPFDFFQMPDLATPRCDKADPDIPSGNKAALTIDLHKGHPVDEPEKEDGLIIDEEREKLVEQNPASENLQET